MKKIFAIALALVMVLSMASAFASECNVGPYDWSCATSTKCGKATIEVIPLVKVNDACGTWKMEVSTCAAAVTSDEVYYAVKLTIPKDIDPDWYAKAYLTVTENGVDGFTNNKWTSNAVALTSIVSTTKMTTDGDETGDGWVYYLNWKSGQFVASAEQTEAEDKLELKDVYWTMKVGNAAKAKVCATLKSENKFESAKVGSYTVSWVANPSKYENALSFVDKDNNRVSLFMDKNDKVQFIEAVVADSCSTQAGLIADVLAKYNLGCGYGLCITEDAVKANFGWKDKQESCFSWSDKAPAVVDAECVVAIPKTGDASVLAWLF